MQGLKCKARARLYGFSVVVESIEDSRCLYGMGFYGHPLGVEKPKSADFNSPVRLSPLETLYLMEKGVLEVYGPDDSRLSPEEVSKILSVQYKDLDLEYPVYKRLRDSGLIVRSGLKFGADFTVYRLGPGLEHAPYIVHVTSYSGELEPTDIVRAGRLSHSVRKAFILASVEPSGSASYLIFKWLVP
ncbi:MAG: tRNA-intron lyase [Desulfurococcales archaeon]|nr:tRNA-intron lyase [Desulfurococcales archaeon]